MTGTTTKEKFDYLASLKSDITYNDSRKELLLQTLDTINVVQHLNTLGISYEKTGEGLVINSLQSIQQPFYYSTNDFLRDFKIEHFNHDIGIIEHELFYDSKNQVFLQNRQITDQNNLILNTYYYLKIKALLSNNLNVNSFANYTDHAKQKIVIISSIKGTMFIGFDTISPEIDPEISLQLFYEKLSNSINAKGYLSFLKSEVYDFLKNVEEKNRFTFLIKNLKTVLDNTDNNFEVYLSNFSFDELRDTLTNERIKYYNISREILSKIYGQITSVPIAISAITFATYKVEDKLTLILIFISFGVYAFFIFRLVNVLNGEIELLEKDFSIETPKIKADCKLDSAEIDKEIQTITDRITEVKSIIKTFKIVFVVLAILFLLFIVYQFSHPAILGDILFLKIVFGFQFCFLNPS